MRWVGQVKLNKTKRNDGAVVRIGALAIFFLKRGDVSQGMVFLLKTEEISLGAGDFCYEKRGDISQGRRFLLKKEAISLGAGDFC